MSQKTEAVQRFLSNLWKWVDGTRRVVFNLLFVVLLIGALSILFKDDDVKIADTTALVVSPNGQLVEQLSGQSPLRMIDEARGSASPEALLKDVVDAIEAGKDDDRVKVLVLNLNSFSGGRLTKLQDVGQAIKNFSESGKKVIAIADNFNQDAYYLAAHADEVLMNRMGILVLEGYGRHKTYMRDGLDRLGADVNVFRVGEYKSAVEPYLRDSMSPEAKEANLEWLGDLWNIYLEDVAAARGVSVEQLVDYASDFPALIERAGGDTAKMALDAGLIDGMTTRDEVRDRLVEMVGEDEDSHSYNRVVYGTYLDSLDEDRFGRKAKGDKVGVIVARGSILDGSHPPGTIGGDSTAALIRQARNDDKIKAIVLRVDSGGGSAFASEVIRRELEVTRADGKPVIVSMGSVAASGGYWISMASDEVWAYPSTITGSIGIFGLFPTFQKPMAEHLGMRVDGVGTAPLAGAIGLDRELSPEIGAVIQAVIDQGYEDFITLVADAREMTTEEVDLIARGRVWSGEDAHEIGLVDYLGDLGDATAAAAKLADLGEDFKVTYIEKELGFKEKIVKMLTARVASLRGEEISERMISPTHEILRLIENQAAVFARFNDPRGIYADSMIEVD